MVGSSNAEDIHQVGRVPVLNDLVIVAARDIYTWREKDSSLEAVSEESVVALGEAVDHLACTLGVANVGKLWFASHCEDLGDVGWLVESSHLGPREVPPLFVSPASVPVVHVAVLGATIAAHPHVVAAIDELQGPGCRGDVTFLPAPLDPL